MKVSVLIGTRNRINSLLRCINSVLKQDYPDFEVFIVDDGSEKIDVCATLSMFTDARIRCLRNFEPLGVAGVRNRLMSLASGDLFCVIDDDAYFADERALSTLVEVFAANPKVGIVATKVIDHRTGHTRLLVPFSKFALLKQPALVDTEQDVSYFVGTCHAIRRDVIERCGHYQSDLVYGEEELDLSYRVVQAGFRIRYIPSVVVHHTPEASVVRPRRFMRNPELYYHARNRVLLARKYIPFRYILPYLIIWMVRYAIQSIPNMSLVDVFTGFARGIVDALRTKREPLAKDAIAYIRNNYGRLWY